MCLNPFKKMKIFQVSGQNLFGVAYSPYRQYGKCPSKAEIEQDKNIAIQHTTRIRLYSTECHLLNDVVLQLSTTYRTGILMGVWIDNDPTRNQKEIEDLYKYLRKYPNANLLGITVGNEVLHRNTLSPEAVAGLVVQVKQGVRSLFCLLTMMSHSGSSNWRGGWEFNLTKRSCFLCRRYSTSCRCRRFGCCWC